MIIGDGSAPIESGAFIVANGRISALGRAGTVTVPAGAARIKDLGTLAVGKSADLLVLDANPSSGRRCFRDWWSLPARPSASIG